MMPEVTPGSPSGACAPGVARARLPQVLVVINNYRQGAFIDDAIASVAGQTYPDLRCVVVDDCSPGREGEIIAEKLERMDDPRFGFARTPSNGGQMCAMMHGLERIEGAVFVAFLDADDFWHRDFLATHIAFHLNRTLPVALTVSDMFTIDRHGTILTGMVTDRSRRHVIEAAPPPVPLDLSEFGIQMTEPGDDLRPARLLRSLLVSWAIWSATSGLVFRASSLQAILPGNPERIRICADGYLVPMAHFVGGTLTIPRALGYYRLHDENNWATGLRLGFGGAEGKVPKPIATAVAEEQIATLEAKRDLFLRARRRHEYDYKIAVLNRTLSRNLGWSIKAAILKRRVKRIDRRLAAASRRALTPPLCSKV